MADRGGPNAGYEQVTLDGLRPLSLGVVTLFGLLLVLDLVNGAAPLAYRVVALDVLVLSVGAVLWFLSSHDQLPPRYAAPGVVAVALLILGDVLFAARGGTQESALCVALILVTIGCFVIDRGWMVAGVGLVCVACVLFWSGQSASPLRELVPFLAGAMFLGFPLRWARRSSLERLLAQRAADAKRQRDLTEALAVAEAARRSLDEKVAERTAELSRTAAELRVELAERQLAIEERAALEARLEHDAMHDALTGLPNRALFLDRLRQAWHRTGRESDFRFAVLYFDLDRFKAINDTFGHEIGDQLLVGIGRRLPKCLRPTDTVARLSGDEFAVLLEGFRSVAETLVIAERIQTSLREPFKLGVHEIYASASIGIADGVVEGQPPEQYVRDADVAMYAAKSRGTPYERFDGGMHSPALARMRMETELRAALEGEQFFLTYQPIVDLRTTRIEGFETLVRWQHPTRGVVGPDDFISLIEETKLMLPLTLWVLRKACRQAVQWRKSYRGAGPLLGVNLSATLFVRPGIAAEILGVLTETGLAPSDLSVEVTESALMASPRIAAAILGELRAQGLQVFVDDFGTGYSSLSSLTTLPVDRLKIDRSFIAAMDDPNRLRVIRTIAMLAHDLGKGLVAEGIETPEQLERLRAMGCEFGQGWLFSRPMDPDQAQALLEANEHACAFPGLVEEPPSFVRTDSDGEGELESALVADAS